MQIKKAVFLVSFFTLMGMFSCADKITSNKNEKPSQTNYTVYTSKNSMFDPAWSPDGSKIALITISKAMDIYKLNANNDTLGFINRFSKRISTSKCAFSPDGRYFIYTDMDYDYTTNRKNTFLYSTDQDSSILYNDIIPENAFLFKWSNDSRYIYYSLIKSNSILINGISVDGTQVFGITLNSTCDIQNYALLPEKQHIVWSGRPNGTANYQIWLYTPENGQQLLLSDDLLNYNQPAWSPDGNRFVYYASDINSRVGSLNIYTIEDNSLITIIQKMYNIGGLVWSEDGQTIYFRGDIPNNDSNSVSIGGFCYSLSSDSYISNGLGLFNHQIQLNPDGSYYALNYYPQIFNLEIFSPTNKTIHTIYTNTDNSLYAYNQEELLQPVWSNDGSYLVISLGGNLCRVSIDGNQPEFLNIQCPQHQYHPDFSPDGIHILFDDGEHIYIVAADGGQAKELSISNYNLSNPVWSPNGKQIACISNSNENDSLIIFDYTDEKLIRVKAWPGLYTDISWSKQHPIIDSNLLYVIQEQPESTASCYELQARKLENGQIVKFIGLGGSLGSETAPSLYACWSPDAESIAWTQYDGHYSNTYSLNIAWIFKDLQ